MLDNTENDFNMDIRKKVIGPTMSDLIDRGQLQREFVPLTEEQKFMLAMSEEDIKEGRTIDQITLNERELEWLKTK